MRSAPIPLQLRKMAEAAQGAGLAWLLRRTLSGRNIESHLIRGDSLRVFAEEGGHKIAKAQQQVRWSRP